MAYQRDYRKVARAFLDSEAFKFRRQETLVKRSESLLWHGYTPSAFETLLVYLRAILRTIRGKVMVKYYDCAERLLG